MNYLKHILSIAVSSTALLSGKEIPFKEYDIEQFLDTKTFTNGLCDYSEKNILFSSDESGIFNIYSKSLETKEQIQLTFSDNNAIQLISTFPQDARFLYSSDGLGNELNHIYIVENGKSTDLTPDQGAKAEFLGWAQDEQSFYYLSNKRDPKFFDLYEMNIADFSSKLIYTNDNQLNVTCISKDKRYVGLHKIINQNTSELYVYDRELEKLNCIKSAKPGVKNVAIASAVDSKSIFYATDDNHEFTYLVEYIIDSDKHKIVRKADWDIQTFSISKQGNYHLFLSNEDGSKRLTVYTKNNEKVELPKEAQGNILSANISRNEDYLVFLLNDCNCPGNIYAYQFATKKLQQITHSLSSQVSKEHLVKGEVVRYPSYDGLLIPNFYYKPQNIPAGMKIPALLWIHGGPGGQSTAGYNYLIQYLVNHGYAVLAVNNRGSSGYGKSFFKAADLKHGEADLDDCMWAKKFLGSTGYIDENKIGIMGVSYGGYMTLAALSFRPEEMAVGVDIFGVSNWVRTLSSIPAWWENERTVLYNKIGNPFTEKEYLESISPLFHADKIKKPLLVLQGANDPRVLQVESDQIIDAVKANQVPCEYVVFPDEGHGFSKKKNKLTAAKSILQFLDQHLKN